jgi:internalin A
MRKLASVLVLLAVVGVGRADDETVINELEKAGVHFLKVSYCCGILGSRADRDSRPNCAFFDNVRGTDGLLDRLADLSNAEKMTVGLKGSDLTDAGLATLGCRLKAVDTLGLSGTAVTDGGLKNLVGLRVRSLYLHDCAGVTDAGVAHIAKVKGLRSISLSGPQVTDAGLEGLAALSDLAEISLSGTAVTDAGVKRLTRLRDLMTLSLKGTKVTDAGLREVGALTKLMSLGLDDTAVSDATLRQLEGLDMLFFLSLVRCPNVTDEGIARLQKALPNCKIIR